MGVIEEVKNLICENSPYEHVWVQRQKFNWDVPSLKHG